MKCVIAIIAFYGLFALFTACTLPKDKLERSLIMARENRGELEKVLLLYKNDSLKYKAACFLIENMQGGVLPFIPDLSASQFITLDKRKIIGDYATSPTGIPPNRVHLSQYTTTWSEILKIKV